MECWGSLYSASGGVTWFVDPLSWADLAVFTGGGKRVAKIFSKETYKEGCGVIYMYCSVSTRIITYHLIIRCFIYRKAIDSDQSS